MFVKTSRRQLLHCHFCGDSVRSRTRYLYCPHISFCTLQHCPTTRPYCFFCDHADRLHPYLAHHLLDDSFLPPTWYPMTEPCPPRWAHKQMSLFQALRQPSSRPPPRLAAQMSQQKTRQQLQPTQPQCATCGHRSVDEDYFMLCPHIYFCSFECMPPSQPVCLDCLL
jgi:hypothetical protein